MKLGKAFTAPVTELELIGGWSVLAALALAGVLLRSITWQFGALLALWPVVLFLLIVVTRFVFGVRHGR